MMRKSVFAVAAAVAATGGSLIAMSQSAKSGAATPQRNDANLAQPRVAVASPFALTLGESTFDPLTNMPIANLRWQHSDRDALGRTTHLIQFTGATQQEWLDVLEANNVEVVQYIYPHAYICWGQDAALENAKLALPTARWSGEFIPAYRVLPQWRSLGAEPVEVHILAVRSGDMKDTIARITEAGGQVHGHAPIDAKLVSIRAVVPGNAFADVARGPAIYSVQPVPSDGGLRGEMTNQINAGNYNGSNIAFPGYMDWLDSINLDGTGVVIANVDGGVSEMHPDLVSRFLPCTGVSCNTTSSTHGTHTAGIMAGDGSSGTMDSRGFLRGLGVAPGANLIEQRYSGIYTQTNGMLTLMKDSFNNGALLSGNSWGPASTPRGYDGDTRQVDVGVRDAVDNVPGNQQLTFVLSFMNGYGGTSSQGTPDEGKNIFNIGSTKGQDTSGAQIADIDDLSDNTAHGPALDGRTIPHMVAPGCRVDSSYSGSGYDELCGTSMASPHVSGAVALFIEHYRNLNGGANPSPALVKAAFMPVSHDLVGNNDADGGTLGHRPDNKQGWGRMDLVSVLTHDPTGVQYIDQETLLDNTAEEWSTTFTPQNPAQPMTIMLVWTDAPGHGMGGSTPAWNNNLDLIVEAGASTYLGNRIGANGFSTTGGAADIKNNAEAVFLPTGSDILVRVVGADINSDGVPNVGDGTDQDFALVCYNCTVEIANPCPSDVAANGGGAPDGVVNVHDLLDLLAQWGGCEPCPAGCTADLTGDCTVDLFDLLDLLAAWGPCP